MHIRTNYNVFNVNNFKKQIPQPQVSPSATGKAIKESESETKYELSMHMHTYAHSDIGMYTMSTNIVQRSMSNKYSTSRSRSASSGHNTQVCNNLFALPHLHFNESIVNLRKKTPLYC